MHSPAQLCHTAVQAWASFAEGFNSPPAHPSSHSPGQCSLLGFHIGEEQRWKWETALGYFRLPLLEAVTYHPLPLHTPGWHPFCHSACHPKGMGTLGTPITPEVPSSFGFHRYGSALMCQRDQFSTCISQGMAMGWSAAWHCCMEWRAVLHFVTLWTHLYTNMELRAVGAGTVQEQPP